ncbi:MAG: M23 family metallopeptidase [Prevotellaceae bacterium]|nr:M23 family metallopeptidase [Prevotellaceae bacterium]
MEEESTFAPPLDFPITFAGNFGEIRADHFHGGLDFKTGGVEGKPVRALADGYVSRIRVTHGSGYVLDVAYENGYSVINRHLSAFMQPIAGRVEDLQYGQESWEVEIVPQPGEYPVKRGQVIALSGNTGYSFGPHLHLDVYLTDTGEFVDPLPFFKRYIKDKVAPRAEAVMLFPQAGKGVVQGVATPRAFPLPVAQTITAWGLVGAGIRAYDYMDGVHNKYGVRHVTLHVDGDEVFSSDVDRFFDEENRYINSWTYNGYMKSFIEPGNRLRMLHAQGGNRGLVTIDEERPYRFVYTLADALGNTSEVAFTVQGKRMEIPPAAAPGTRLFKWNETNFLQLPGLELVVPKGCLYDDARLDCSVRADSGDIAFTYRLSSTRVPLHKVGTLRIGLRHDTMEDVSKYYVAMVRADGRKQSVGGVYEHGYMKAGVYQIGAFTVAVDTVPPVVTPVNPSGWGRAGRIVFKAKDKETGVAAYYGTVDGAYALFGKLNAMNGDLVCALDEKHVKKGGSHTVELTVTDACGNSAVSRQTFVW